MRRFVAGVVVAGLLGTLVLGAAGGPVRAQGILFPAFNETPIDIEARDGIEWLRHEKRFIARGDVMVQQDDMVVHAEVVSVTYDDNHVAAGGDDGSDNDTSLGMGGAHIVLIEATGNVYLEGPSGSAYAEKAVYHIVNQTLALSGYQATILHEDMILRADKQFTYWHDNRLAVASGGAQVERGRSVLGGDTLVAHFMTSASGGLVLDKVDAYGDVFASDPSQRVTGQQGRYDANSGIADILGDVAIYYGEQYLHGEHARFDFKRGVSRLMAGRQASQGGAKQRIRGVFDVEDLDEDKDDGKE